MPELPEVETVVRDLRPLLQGRSITAVRKSKQKLRRAWSAKATAAVIGAHITGIRRRGKWILIDLRSKAKPGPAHPVLRVHLGMTGQFTVVPANESLATHVHVVFSLDNKTELRFRDQRRFGSVEYFASHTNADAKLDAQLGPEPFGLDPASFRDAVRASARNLKAILLDQSIVAGVGNIYADEACFRAKLHPARSGKSLSVAECDALRDAIESVITSAIESRGSTIRDYVGGSGLRGGFQNEFAVYGRTGENCHACKTAIACIRLAGRASHYCPQCQVSGFRIPDSGKDSRNQRRRRQYAKTKTHHRVTENTEKTRKRE